MNAIEPHASPPVWAMVQLQILTGARSGEITAMRGCDLNTSGRVWEYVPASHKTQHHGKRRMIFLGPKAQAIVREFLQTDLSAYLFSPKDGRARFVAATYRADAKPAGKGKRAPGERYTPSTYANAIKRACAKAEIPHWHPHQLRHSAATASRRAADLDTARTVLGHSSLNVAEIYAEADLAKARAIVGRLG